MRAAFVTEAAGIDGIAFREVAEPAPGPGEALVRLHAATLNYRDLIMVRGSIPGLVKPPAVIPLSCGVGVVSAVGAGVTRVTPGDRVSPIMSLDWLSGPVNSGGAMLGGSADGVACPLAVFPAESLVHLPDTLGDLDAATYPCAGLTAWSALFGARPIALGEWVLLQGTGGVSIAALQLAKAAGAKVAITSSSDAKLARAAALGADLTVNYRTTDWIAAVRDALGADRAAILLDVAGGDGIDAAAGLLAEDGIVAAIGMLDGDFSWSRGEIAGRLVVPIGVGNRDAHEAMLAFVAEHRIRPVIDAVYDLDRLPDAYRHLASGDFFGKIGVNLR